MATSLKWTSSSLGVVLFCGPRYQFKYLDKIKVPTRPPLVRGTIVHETARLSMRGRQAPRLTAAIEAWGPRSLTRTELEQARSLQTTAPGELPSVDLIADAAATAFEKKWGAEDVDLRGEEGSPEAIRGATKDLSVSLSMLHREKLAPHIEPLGVEMRVTVEPKDIAVVLEGTIDLVAVSEHGYRIRDLKTSEKAPNRHAADESPQFDMYSLLGLAKFGQLPEDLQLDHVWQTPARKDRKYESLPTTRDADDVQAIINRINAATLAVEKGILVPAPSDSWMCQNCEYREARNGFPGCPYVRRGDRRPTN